MLFNQDLSVALDKVAKKDAKLCVIGVGTVGLPLATFLAGAGFNVVGLDKSEKRCEEINNGSCNFEYTEMMKGCVSSGKLKATIDSSVLSDMDAIFVCVPTPLKDTKDINLSYLKDAAGMIAENLKRGVVVVVESSVALGNTSYIGKLIEEKSGMKIGTDFGLAYCPERYNPTLPMEMHPVVVHGGNYEKVERHTVDKVPRVLGASDDKSLQIAKRLYSSFLNAPIKEVSSIEAAEASKLTENIFRDVNIALVNELSQIYSKFGLDTFEIVNAAKTKPFAFLPHYPSTGVGGECIPVDTWYLISQAEKAGCDTRLMKSAREVNDSMPKFVMQLLSDALSKSGKSLSGSDIALLGVAYKANIPDVRLSPSLELMEMLRSAGANVHLCDPVLKDFGGANHNVKFELKSVSDVLDGKDAVILATDHDVFKQIGIEDLKKLRTRIVVDGRNFFNEESLLVNGFVYRGVGKKL